MSQPIDIVSLTLRAADGQSSPRPWVELAADLARVAPGQVVLEGALTHPELPRVMATLVERRAVTVLRLDDTRVSRAIGIKLLELGVVGVEADLFGAIATHDRRTAAGSWRARAGSLRACRESRLHTRVRVHVDRTVVDELPELLPLVEVLAHDVILIEEGPLSAAECERALRHASKLRGVAIVGLGVHGPSRQGDPIAIDETLWHALSRGARIPRAEAGILAAESPRLGAVVEQAGGLRALGLRLEAMGTPALDLPRCLGGRARAEVVGTFVAACDRCPARDRCAGIPTSLAERGSSEVAPRRSWTGVGLGARVHVLPTHDHILREFALDALTTRLGSHGCTVSSGESASADRDLVIAWNFTQALDVLDRVPLALSARVVVGDFHMLVGREALAARAARGWPDERLSITSCFPSFAHLYARAGIPLERVRWRPYPVAHGRPRPTLASGFAGGGHMRDWALLEKAARRLGARCPPVRVAHSPNVEVARVYGLQPVGWLQLVPFVEAIATASYVVIPATWDRDRCTGGTVMALALAFGRPTIATRVPMALDHLRDGVDSILVDPGDEAGLADALDRMANDHPLRARLAEGAAMRGRLSSAEAWADELVLGALPPADLGTRPWA